MLGRYVEIQQLSGDAETMYPDIAAHLEVCPVCNGLHADLAASADEPDRERFASRLVALDQLVSDLPITAIPQTPVDMLSREEIVLRVSHVRSAAGNDDPAAGYLLFYDTLHVGKLNLVAIFTLHRSDHPGLYRVEGVISPEQPALRYKAVLWQETGPLEAHIEGTRLIFDDVSIGPETNRLIVTLAVHSRWRPRQ